MSLRWQCVVVDCADPEPVATFWAAALGWRRLHLDLRPSGDQAAEVARLEVLGASRADVGQDEGAAWVVLADVEGNELCVLRPYGAHG